MNKRIVLMIVVCTIALVAVLLTKESGIFDSETRPHMQAAELESEFMIETMEEYASFLETAKALPKNFVTMDMLEDLGTFCRFLWTTGDTSYNYGVILENGEYMTIVVEHEPKMETKNYLDISQTGETMLDINTTEKGTVVSNGMEYYYVPNGLISVSWMINGVEIMLCWNNDLETALPLLENHILSKIFSKSSDDQIAALNQLKAKMETN